jgi:hypothetical protein
MVCRRISVLLDAPDHGYRSLPPQIFPRSTSPSPSQRTWTRFPLFHLTRIQPFRRMKLREEHQRTWMPRRVMDRQGDRLL